MAKPTRATSAPTDSEDITARSVTIVDEEGQPLILIGENGITILNSDGGTGIGLTADSVYLSSRGNVVAMLGTGSRGAFLTLNDGTGTPGIDWHVSPGGKVSGNQLTEERLDGVRDRLDVLIDKVEELQSRTVSAWGRAGK